MDKKKEEEEEEEEEEAGGLRVWDWLEVWGVDSRGEQKSSQADPTSCFVLLLG